MSGTSLGSAEIALVVFLIYWAVVESLRRKGVLERRNISTIGPILMIRTKRGLGLLDRLSRFRRFWRSLADFGIPLVFFGMFFMFSVIVLTDYVMLKNPSRVYVSSPKEYLLIPGVNPFIPLVWGLIGLVVTLIVHELSHAVLCRVEGVRVKSLGVLLALIPIGGFAEPDESELMDREKVKSVQRLRIFSAGVASNFFVALIAFSLFFYLLGFLKPHVIVMMSRVKGVKNGSVVLEINGIPVWREEDVKRAVELGGGYVTIKLDSGVVRLKKVMGVYVVKTIKGYPARKAGIRGGMVITEINGIKTPTLKEFIKIMRETKPNETITVKVYDGKEFKVYKIKLAKSPYGDYGFLGVMVAGDYLSGLVLGYSGRLLNSLRSIPRMLTNVKGWLYVVAMPLMFQGFCGRVKRYYTSTLGDWLFWILNSLYWIGWINFYIGLFNCLPAIPLDGGRVFHEALTNVFTEDTSSLIVRILAVIVFSAILLSILIPNIRIVI